MMTSKPNNTDEYISSFPKETQELLQQLRGAIKQAAPKAEEVISYNMPAFKMNGILVYFAGCKNHIGFYPMPSSIKFFEKELADYKTSKGAIQFPNEKGIPTSLVKKIVRFRIQEVLEKAILKKTTKR